MGHTAALFPDRAQRFPIMVPIHFRKSGMSHWLDGKTVNISRTGILFQADETFSVDSILDIQVEFPTESALKCRGSVVRTEKSLVAVQLQHPNLYHRSS